MDEQGGAPPVDYDTQLVQVRVPLEQAAEIFATSDTTGRVPIVVVPDRPLRIRVELLLIAAAVLAGGIVAGWFFSAGPLLTSTLIVVSVGLALAAIFQAFQLRVPEGTQALLASGGRYWKTVRGGTHLVPPWIAVTHLVTCREVPFDSPAIEAPTSDLVRSTIDTLITFTITDPYRFVYSISASDFDVVLQAACQDAVRQSVRHITSDEVLNLTRAETTALVDVLGKDVAPYGVSIAKVNITYARPPADFVQTQEARQLAILKRAEQVEQQELTLRRLADTEELERQRVIAIAARQREVLHQEIEQAQLRRQLIELEADNEALRLGKLEERLRAFPAAAKYDWESEQLTVAKALAGNSRAVLQVGDAGDISRVLMIRDLNENTNGAAPLTEAPDA